MAMHAGSMLEDETMRPPRAHPTDTRVCSFAMPTVLQCAQVVMRMPWPRNDGASLGLHYYVHMRTAMLGAFLS